MSRFDAKRVLVAQTSVCAHFRSCENENHTGSSLCYWTVLDLRCVCMQWRGATPTTKFLREVRATAFSVRHSDSGILIGACYLLIGIFSSEESWYGSKGLHAKYRSPILMVGTFRRPSFTCNTSSSASGSSSIFTSEKSTPRSSRNFLARRQSTHQLVP